MKLLLLLALVSIAPVSRAGQCEDTRLATLAADPRNSIDRGAELDTAGIKTLEAGKMFDVPGKGPLPFGHAYEFWVEIKAKLKPGDRVYWIEHNDPEHGFQRKDHLFVRNGCVFAVLNWSIT